MKIGILIVFIVCIQILICTVGLQRKNELFSADNISPIPKRKRHIYEKYIKRMCDLFIAELSIIMLLPVVLFLCILVKVKLGSPIIFVQERPGIIDNKGHEIIFKMYKFRTMTNEKDINGKLLPDEKRLTKFGKWLRSTSLDELPELFNVINGTMSLIGPRPQLVRDLVFMSDEQRVRHTARPGLSGLAQVNGRNNISWEEKFEWDKKYIQKISFFTDLMIIVKTINKAFIKKEGITQTDFVTAEDFGDYLLRTMKITQNEYNARQDLAKEILSE